MAAALRACGWLFLRGRRPTNALAERLLACARGEARYAKLRGGVGVIDTVKTRAIADFLPEVREFLWLNNPCACNEVDVDSCGHAGENTRASEARRARRVARCSVF